MAKNVAVINWLNKPIHRSVSYGGAFLVYGELLVAIAALIAMTAMYVFVAGSFSADYWVLLMVFFALYGVLIVAGLAVDSAIALWRLLLRKNSDE